MAHDNFRLLVAGLDPKALAVASFTGSERVSRPFRFSIRCCGDPSAVGAPEDLLGSPARLVVCDGDGEARRIQGVVRRIALETIDPATGLGWYLLTLAPRLALGRYRRNSRVFQEQSVPDIVAAIFGEHELRFDRRLGRSYATRPYCVQYQETDFDFVARLLAEEGIFYWFEDPPPESRLDTGECLVLADAAEAYTDLEGETVLHYRGQAALRQTAATLERFEAVTALKPHACEVRAFDFLRPELALRHHGAVPAPKGRPRGVPLEVYDYRYDLEEPELPKERAQSLLEALRTRKERAAGTSQHRRMAVGRTFEVADHPLAALSRRFVVERIKHRGEAPEVGSGRGAASAAAGAAAYENRFECLPAAVAARPKPAKRRVQQVIETATVVGPPGEEIYTDEHGRVKVQFHWDREGKKDDKSSCWVRVGQTWAGSGWGAQFIPRVGMEVVVAFSGGDTDRPVVLSSLYNRTHPVPFSLPGDKTKSGLRTASTPGGGGSNELCFDDAAGAEQIYVHAQRDHDEVVERNHSRAVRGDEVVSVTGSRETTVAQDFVRTIHGHEIVTIHRNMVVHVAGRQELQIDGGTDADRHVADALQAFAAAMTETPPPVATPDPPPEREGLEAMLTYRVASAPLQLVKESDGMERKALALVGALAPLREEAAVLAGIADRLAAVPGDIPDPNEMLPAVYQLAERSQRLCAAVDLLRPELASLQADPCQTELAPVKGAVDALVESALREADAMRAATTERAAALLQERHIPLSPHLVPAAQAGAVAGVQEALERALANQPAELERVRGLGSGGGPGSIKKTSESQEFSAPPKPGSGERQLVYVPDGQRITVKPSAIIDAEVGLRLRSNPTFVEITPAGVVLRGPYIRISGDTIDIVGGTVNINGGPIALKGSTITASAGTVDVKGTPIKLNS